MASNASAFSTHEQSWLDQELRRVPYDGHFLELSWRWLNNPEIKYLTDTPTFSQQQQHAWFAGLSQRTDYLIWGVELHGEQIGVFGIKHITLEDAEYWGYIGERKYWGRGIGQWMIRMSEAEARRRGIQRLYLRVIRDNERARKAYERAGYNVREVQGERIIMEKHLDGRKNG